MPRTRRIRAGLAAVMLLVTASSGEARRAPAHAPHEPDTALVVSAGWLVAHHADPAVVVLHVGHSDSLFRTNHVADARYLPYHRYTADVNGIRTELPPVDSLVALFESVGVSDNSHVIITGPPLMATRAFFTLDYLGLRHVGILDGGLRAWRAAGGVVAAGESPVVRRGRITPSPRPEIVATSEWMLAHLGKPGVSLIDTRTVEEYDGAGARAGLRSDGHLDGARRLEWQEANLDQSEFAPKDRSELAWMWAARALPGDTVAAYCLVGYRASFTYFVSRYLGYPVKLYDGSYDEWSQKKLPLVKTPTPLRVP